MCKSSTRIRSIIVRIWRQAKRYLWQTSSWVLVPAPAPAPYVVTNAPEFHILHCPRQNLPTLQRHCETSSCRAEESWSRRLADRILKVWYALIHYIMTIYNCYLQCVLPPMGYWCGCRARVCFVLMNPTAEFNTLRFLIPRCRCALYENIGSEIHVKHNVRTAGAYHNIDIHTAHATCVGKITNVKYSTLFSIRPRAHLVVLRCPWLQKAFGHLPLNSA